MNPLIITHIQILASNKGEAKMKGKKEGKIMMWGEKATKTSVFLMDGLVGRHHVRQKDKGGKMCDE